MDNSIYDTLQDTATYLKLSISSQEIAQFCTEKNLDEGKIGAISEFMTFLKNKRHENHVGMLQTMSRIPHREPKTFENFDFSRINGKNVDALKNLPSLSSLHAHKNLAFIGPQGVGKTHLAMAYGKICYENEYKAYFLKATELNLKFTDARKQGKEKTVIDSLVAPACLML